MGLARRFQISFQDFIDGVDARKGNEKCEAKTSTCFSGPICNLQYLEFVEVSKEVISENSDDVKIKASDDINKKNLLKPWQLTEGKLYRVFISNLMGLVRYQQFDIVKCTGWFNSIPLLEFYCRDDRSLILCGTPISELDLFSSLVEMKYLDYFSQDTTLEISIDKGGRNLVIKYDDSASQNRSFFLSGLDRLLGEKNINYGVLRNSGVIKEIVLDFQTTEQALKADDFQIFEKAPSFKFSLIQNASKQ